MPDHTILKLSSTSNSDDAWVQAFSRKLLDLPKWLEKEMARLKSPLSDNTKQSLLDFQMMALSIIETPEISSEEKIQLLTHQLTISLKSLDKNAIRTHLQYLTGYKKDQKKLYQLLNSIIKDLKVQLPALKLRQNQSLYQHHINAIIKQKKIITRNEKLITLCEEILKDCRYNLNYRKKYLKPAIPSIGVEDPDLETLSVTISHRLTSKLELIIEQASYHKDILNDNWLEREKINYILMLHPLLFTSEGFSHLKHINPKKIDDEKVTAINHFIASFNEETEGLKKFYLVLKHYLPLKHLPLIEHLHPMLFTDRYFKLISEEPRLSISFIQRINKIIDTFGESILPTLLYLQDRFFLTELPLDSLLSLPSFFLTYPKTIKLLKILNPFDTTSVSHLTSAWNKFKKDIDNTNYNIHEKNSLIGAFIDTLFGMYENGLEINKADCYLQLGPAFYNSLAGRQFLKRQHDGLNKNTVTALQLYLKNNGSLRTLEQTLQDAGFNLNTLKGLPDFILTPSILLPLIRDKVWLGLEGRALLFKLKPLFNKEEGLNFVLKTHPKEIKRNLSFLSSLKHSSVISGLNEYRYPPTPPKDTIPNQKSIKTRHFFNHVNHEKAKAPLRETHHPASLNAVRTPATSHRNIELKQL